ncbi:hypothetical protein [Desulfobacter latus]|uniref:Uncharacterized protein n=1 Tax=Desulfobacter latus TaxID=2292 RepID=A0A850T4P0_9BACT|nr:hypothetical protein [Desulfobacter latus]NWH03805.1 hypothetical protein [Desulfobacter latus]
MKHNTYKLINFTVLVVLYLSLPSNVSFASGEGFRLYPVLGKIGQSTESEYVLNATSNFLSYKSYLGQSVYDYKSESTINRYLIIKALEIGVQNNELYKNDLQLIDEAFTKYDEALKNWSLEYHLKEIFGAGGSALLGLTTDLVGQEVTVKGYINHILKIVLNSDPIKSELTELFGWDSMTYEFYKTIILSSTDLVLEWMEWQTKSSIEIIMWKSYPTEQFITTLSNSFSKFVGLPIACYEALLNTLSLGNAAHALYDLANTEHESQVNMWATAFIYDYINQYGSDLNLIKKEIENYSNEYDYLCGIKLYKGYTKVTTFFDIFFWYTAKNIHPQTINKADKANLVRAARLALDLIENYGNGGNFSTYGEYQLKKDSENNFYKAIDFTENPINGFDLLYYMPLIEPDRSDDDSIWFDFYYRNYTPYLDIPGIESFHINLSYLPRVVTYSVNPNITQYVVKDTVEGQYFIGKKKYTYNNVEQLYLKIAPEVTIQIVDKFGNLLEQQTQTVNYDPIIIPYGYKINYSDKSFTFGIDAVIDLYNRCLLDTYQESFQPLQRVTVDQFLNLFYSYILNETNHFMNGKLDINAFWNKCVQSNSCGAGNLLENRLDFITRGQVADIMTAMISFNQFKIEKKFSNNKTGWTDSGKTLYEFGVMCGDKNGSMNASSPINMIELAAMLKRLKDLHQFVDN